MITNENKKPLAFASVLIKGTLRGTTANNQGFYSIAVNEGEYILVVQYVGYKSVEKKVIVGKEEININFELSEQTYQLGNVVVKKGEDPAYEIIRNAIKKRKIHEEENKKFTTEVYIKGQLKLRDYPKKFMGSKVDFEDGDTSKRKIIFLSESVAKYSVDLPKRKIEVVSTKVSGQSDGFGFSSPQIFSFYQNNIRLGNLNPRGFISPISNNALSYYRYKFEGTFFESNKMISRIKVIPKRNYEPLFNGYINIIEDEWRIHSVQMTLYKRNQMQIVDTLQIEQLYVQLGDTWVIKQQTIQPAIKFFTFDATGFFVQVYDKFNINPKFPKGFFDNTILKFEDSSQKKPLSYWDSVRPVPLLKEEIRDYIRKDSLEKVKKDPHYQDSLDRVRNKPNLVGIFLTGQSFGKERRKSSISFPALLNQINYNTMEGAVVQLSADYEKRFSETERKRLEIKPTLRYGFNNKHFNPWLLINYLYGKKYYSSITVSGGRRVFQFDNNNPVRPFLNTITTLQYERNFLKLYEANFGRITYSKELGKGITAIGDIQYQDRYGLANTTDYKFKDYAKRQFTPNFEMPNNKAFLASATIRWQPGAQYIELPGRKFSIGSKYPAMSLTYTLGIKKVLGSDADFSKWRFNLSDRFNLKLFGAIDYRLSMGGFITKKSVYLPDFQHFIGNQHAVVAQYLEGFQLMPFYAYQNTEKFYATALAEYHLNGLLTNKIPGFKKLNWYLVTSSNALYLQKGKWYSEVFIGLENILKIFRVDYVRSYSGDNNNGRSGIRISLPIILNGIIRD